MTVVVWVGVGPWAARSAAAEEAEGAPKHDDPKSAEARAHYEEGTKAYNLGEYPRAVTEFKAAYNAKPDPLLLYNIAQSFRLGGDATQALFFYRSFLRNMPGSPNRKEVEGRIRTLEKQIEKQAEKQGDKQNEEQKHEGAVPPAGAPPPAVAAPASTAAPTSPAPASTPVAPPSSTARPALIAPPPLSSPPTATEPAAPTSPGVDLSQAPASEPAPSSSPFYKKWWFWTGVGVVLVVGIVAAAARDKPPSTTYGLHNPTFTP